MTPTEALRLIDPRLDEVVGLPVVRDLLRSAVGESFGDHSLSSEQIDVLLDHRVTPLIPASWEVESDLRNLTVSLAGVDLRLRAALADVDALLRGAGLKYLVLKGMATAHHDYPRRGLRHSGDIDILVRRDELPAVWSTLVDAGHVADETADRRYAKGMMFVHPSGVEIDVHTWLTLYVEQSDELLFANRTAPGAELPALSPAGRLVHAASHLFYSPPGMPDDPAGQRRLTSAADIVAIQSAQDVDEDELLALAMGLNVAAIVGCALHAVRGITGLGLEPSSSWPEPTWLERRAMLRETRSPVLDNLLGASGRAGLTNKLGYLWQQLAPSKAVIDDIGGYRNYFAKALKR